jgi:acyl carrier protein
MLEPSLGTGPEAPGVDDLSPVEAFVAQTIREALPDRFVGRHDNLFALGADSKTALQVLARLEQFYGVPFDVEAAFSDPTIATLAEAVDQALHRAIEGMTDEEAAAALDAWSDASA